MATVYFRNVITGAITQLDSDDDAAEIRALVAQRHDRGEGRAPIPLHEQTGAHDADPANHAAAEEIAARARWNVEDISQVTADGIAQDQTSEERMGQAGPDVANPLIYKPKLTRNEAREAVGLPKMAERPPARPRASRARK